MAILDKLLGAVKELFVHKPPVRKKKVRAVRKSSQSVSRSKAKSKSSVSKLTPKNQTPKKAVKKATKTAPKKAAKKVPKKAPKKVAKKAVKKAVKKTVLKKASVKKSNGRASPKRAAVKSVAKKPSVKAEESRSHKNNDIGSKVGEITHYFNKISVCVVKLSHGPLKKGDILSVITKQGAFQQTVSSMQVESEDVTSAKKGQHIGLKITQPVKPGDQVYKVKA